VYSFFIRKREKRLCEAVYHQNHRKGRTVLDLLLSTYLLSCRPQGIFNRRSCSTTTRRRAKQPVHRAMAELTRAVLGPVFPPCPLYLTQPSPTEYWKSPSEPFPPIKVKNSHDPITRPLNTMAVIKQTITKYLIKCFMSSAAKGWECALLLRRVPLFEARAKQSVDSLPVVFQ
jgi:hypothetical protein